MFWAIIFSCFTQLKTDCSLEFRYISWHKTLLACVQLSPPLSDFFLREGGRCAQAKLLLSDVSSAEEKPRPGVRWGALKGT